jgi:hypothetical protein
MSSYADLEIKEPGPILVFYGPSTSGKTSLIEELKKTHQGPLIEFGLDLQIAKMLLQLENSEYREEFRSAEEYFTRGEIFTALVRKEVDIPRRDRVFILNIEESMDLVLSRASSRGIDLTGRELSGIEILKKLIDDSYHVFHIENLNYEKVFIEIFKEMLRSSRNGDTVVADLAPITFEKFLVHKLLTDFIEREGFEGKVQSTLVLCPFKILLERIKNRNHLARKMKKTEELREGVFPFFQYAQLFNASGVERLPSVDSIRYRDLTEAVESTWSRPNTLEIVERLASKLGITDREREYSIQAQVEYDLLLINENWNSLNVMAAALRWFLDAHSCRNRMITKY